MKKNLPIKTFVLISFTCAALQAATGSETKKWTMATSLYGDPKAQRVGDLLTVLIQEESEVSMNARNSSRKSSGTSGNMSFGHPRVDDIPTSWTNFVIPAWNLDAERSFTGDGSRESQDSFSSRITVQVTDIMPNGNLLIEGSRSLRIHEDSVRVVLTGTVRPSDISRNNEIVSSRIADTTVRYESAGPLVKNARRGILTALLNWINPF